MEIRKKYIAIVLVVVFALPTLTGCGKVYSDYTNTWISEDGNVKLEPSGVATICYNGIDQNWEIQALSDSGQSDLYFEYKDNNAVGDSNLIWEAFATIKGDKLYLEIKDDRYTNLEGQTIILRQSEE